MEAFCDKVTINLILYCLLLNLAGCYQNLNSKKSEHDGKGVLKGHPKKR